MNRADRRAKGERRVVVGTQELANGKVLPVTEWQQVVKPAHVSKPVPMTRHQVIDHMVATGKMRLVHITDELING